LVLSKRNFEIKRNDVVVIEEDGDKLVKRIVGMPNDTVEVAGGYIYINDKKIEDSFGIGRITYYLTDEDDKILTYWSGPNIGRPVVKFAEHSKITLSEEEYYYIGDHRSISMYGVAKKINVVGKIVGGF
jgi:signal peptidase I